MINPSHGDVDIIFLTVPPHQVPRILMLNGSHDRETAGMGACQVVQAITGDPFVLPLDTFFSDCLGLVIALADALNQSRTDGARLEPSAYVNTVFYPAGGTFNMRDMAVNHQIQTRNVLGYGSRSVHGFSVSRLLTISISRISWFVSGCLTCVVMRSLYRGWTDAMCVSLIRYGMPSVGWASKR